MFSGFIEKFGLKLCCRSIARGQPYEPILMAIDIGRPANHKATRYAEVKSVRGAKHCARTKVKKRI
jgi:hypothetical protein